jgi:hypothetical protein
MVSRFAENRLIAGLLKVAFTSKDAARSASETHATILRKPNALQEKPPRSAALIAGRT